MNWKLIQLFAFALTFIDTFTHLLIAQGASIPIELLDKTKSLCRSDDRDCGHFDSLRLTQGRRYNAG